jgi:hypothetical protein
MLSLREPLKVGVVVKSDDAEVADAAEVARGGWLPSLGRRALGVALDTLDAGELNELKVVPLGEAWWSAKGLSDSDSLRRCGTTLPLVNCCV